MTKGKAQKNKYKKYNERIHVYTDLNIDINNAYIYLRTYVVVSIYIYIHIYIKWGVQMAGVDSRDQQQRCRSTGQ